MKAGEILDSTFIMFPSGHARNSECDLNGILSHKFNLLGNLALASQSEVESMMTRLNSLETLSNDDL